MSPSGIREKENAGRRPWIGATAGQEGTSEDLQHLHAVLARRAGEVAAAVESAGIVLVGQVGGIAGDSPAAMLPGELRVEDAASAQAVAERRILEQRGPLRADMAEIRPRNDLVLVADIKGILRTDVEGDVRRIGLLTPLH